jgi:hypothetical protein
MSAEYNVTGSCGGGGKIGECISLCLETGTGDEDILVLDMSWETAKNIHESLGMLLEQEI